MVGADACGLLISRSMPCQNGLPDLPDLPDKRGKTVTQ